MKKLLFPLMILLLAVPALARVKTVKGTVNTSNNQPIPGVSVKAPGTNSGQVTDEHGRYTITVDDTVSSLTFSYIGMIAQTIAIPVSNVLNVQLVADPQSLSTILATAQSRSERISTLSGYHSAPAVPMAKKLYRPIGQPTESYASISENGFHIATKDPLSTFSIDVDAASYSNVRRFINGGNLPPADAVRIEEMINYFQYNYAQPTGNDPVNIITNVGVAPWNKDHKIVQIALKGKQQNVASLPASNLVFLIDVSGSMSSHNKLPLLVSSLKMLTDQLREKDKVSIVVYAGNAGIVLPATNGNHKIAIKSALDRLQAGGSTAGGQGIQLAYKVAGENFVKGGNNRVILATDGDFNVGASSDQDMEKLITAQRESGIFLTVLGYGMGNYKDSKMEVLANKGNGNYAYIDNISEARKVLVKEFGGTMHTIAKDVKLQVEFNPAKVASYRLIGYENRMLASEDFNNDRKDAGEMGVGHTVTALYEIIPVGVKSNFSGAVDPLKYQKPAPQQYNNSAELITVKLRYKAPLDSESKLIQTVVPDRIPAVLNKDFQFSMAVAEFGMLLTRSQFRQNASFDNVLKNAKSALGDDEEGYRAEFLGMVRSAKLLAVDLLSLNDQKIMPNEQSPYKPFNR